MKNLLDTLFAKSGHDLETARIILQERPEQTDIIVFHCQQTVEKALKAFLVFNQVRIKTNHDLTELLMECSGLDPYFLKWKTDLFFRLDEIGISVRYTDMDDDPTIRESGELLGLAEEIFVFVHSRIEPGLK